MNLGIDQIESMKILSLDPLKRFGSPTKIVGYFGGKAAYLSAVRSLEEAIYEVA